MVILRDPDGFELCFADESAYDALSAPREGAERIDWAARERRLREVEGGAVVERKESAEEEPRDEGGRRLVDESEFAEGGDEKQNARAQSERTKAAAEEDSAAFTNTPWESSPHEKVASPAAESKLQQ